MTRVSSFQGPVVPSYRSYLSYDDYLTDDSREARSRDLSYQTYRSSVERIA